MHRLCPHPTPAPTPESSASPTTAFEWLPPPTLSPSVAQMLLPPEAFPAPSGSRGPLCSPCPLEALLVRVLGPAGHPRPFWPLSGAPLGTCPALNVRPVRPVRQRCCVRPRVHASLCSLRCPGVADSAPAQAFAGAHDGRLASLPHRLDLLPPRLVLAASVPTGRLPPPSAPDKGLAAPVYKYPPLPPLSGEV